MNQFISNIEKIYRIYFPKKIKGYQRICKLFKNKYGIEVGGPSSILSKKGFLPIYNFNLKIDNVNFSNQTIWEGSLTEGKEFFIDKLSFIQFIKEASDLRGISDSKYDFIISSHNIEHLANPLKTIKEWKRVVKPYGYFLFIVPNKEGTFDHNRPVTTIEHLVEDLTNNTTEADETHFEEVLTLHDLKADPGGLDFINFKERTLANFENRCVHHHVFDLELLSQVALTSNIKILALQKFSKMHILLLGQNIK